MQAIDVFLSKKVERAQRHTVSGRHPVPTPASLAPAEDRSAMTLNTQKKPIQGRHLTGQHRKMLSTRFFINRLNNVQIALIARRPRGKGRPITLSAAPGTILPAPLSKRIIVMNPRMPVGSELNLGVAVIEEP